MKTVLFFSSISFDNAAQNMRTKGEEIVVDLGWFSILLNFILNTVVMGIVFSQTLRVKRPSVDVLTLVFLLISNLTNGLRLHYFFRD